MTNKMNNITAGGEVKSKYRRVIPTRVVYMGKLPEIDEPDDLEIDDKRPFNFSRYLDEKKGLMAVSGCEKNESPFLMMDQISNSNLPPEVKKFLANMLENSYKPDGRKNTSKRQFLAHQRLLAFEAGFTSDVDFKSQREFKTKKELLEYLAIAHNLATNSIEKKSEWFKKANQQFQTDWDGASQIAKKRETERALKEQKSMDAF